jgi:hypothetical protein
LDGEFVVLAVLAVCGDKGVFSFVKIVEKALVQRKAGPENGAEHYLVIREIAIGYSQRGFHLFRGISEGFADLVSKDFADPFKISAETHTLFLNNYVPEFRNIAVEEGVFFA